MNKKRKPPTIQMSVLLVVSFLIKQRAVKHTNTYMHTQPTYTLPYYSQLTHIFLFSSIHCTQTHTTPLRKIITMNKIKTKKS